MPGQEERQGDLMLCAECEEHRFPNIGTSRSTKVNQSVNKRCTAIDTVTSLNLNDDRSSSPVLPKCSQESDDINVDCDAAPDDSPEGEKFDKIVVNELQCYMFNRIDVLPE